MWKASHLVTLGHWWNSFKNTQNAYQKDPRITLGRPAWSMIEIRQQELSQLYWTL